MKDNVDMNFDKQMRMLKVMEYQLWAIIILITGIGGVSICTWK